VTVCGKLTDVRSGLLITLPQLPLNAYLRFVLGAGNCTEDAYYGRAVEMSRADLQVQRLTGVWQWPNHALIIPVGLPAQVCRLHALLVAEVEADWTPTQIEVWNTVTNVRYGSFALGGQTRSRCTEAFQLRADAGDSLSGARHTWELWPGDGSPAPYPWG
jgi:hypothetical protein